MSLFSLAPWAMQTVTVVKPTWTDDRGTQVPDYDTAALRFDVACRIQPGSSSEDLAARQSSIIRWTLYAPLDTDLHAFDAVEYLGVRYAIDAEPMRWPSPTRRLDHLRALLIDWKG